VRVCECVCECERVVCVGARTMGGASGAVRRSDQCRGREAWKVQPRCAAGGTTDDDGGMEGSPGWLRVPSAVLYIAAL